MDSTIPEKLCYKKQSRIISKSTFLLKKKKPLNKLTLMKSKQDRLALIKNRTNTTKKFKLIKKLNSKKF